MRELPLFSIEHSHIEKIQKNWTEKGSMARSNELRYVNAFKAMIWLEEKVQTEFLIQFNTDDIKLIKNPDPKIINIFRLKKEKDVSHSFFNQKF